MRANGIVDDASATPSTSRRWRLAAAVTLAGRSDGRSAAANCARVSLGVDICCARIGIRSLDQATLEGTAPSGALHLPALSGARRGFRLRGRGGACAGDGATISDLAGEGAERGAADAAVEGG